MSTLARLKAFLTGAGDGPESQYVCVSCQTRFERQPQVCPDCDGYDVRRAEWVDGVSGPQLDAEE